MQNDVVIDAIVCYEEDRKRCDAASNRIKQQANSWNAHKHMYTYKLNSLFIHNVSARLIWLEKVLPWSLVVTLVVRRSCISSPCSNEPHHLRLVLLFSKRPADFHRITFRSARVNQSDQIWTRLIGCQFFQRRHVQGEKRARQSRYRARLNLCTSDAATFRTMSTGPKSNGSEQSPVAAHVRHQIILAVRAQPRSTWPLLPACFLPFFLSIVRKWYLITWWRLLLPNQSTIRSTHACWPLAGAAKVNDHRSL